MIKSNHNNRLKYTDLAEMFRKVGVDKNMGKELSRTLIITHKTYGSEYFVKRATELVSHPQRHGLNFPPSLGKIVLINYLLLGYKHFDDSNYYEAIKRFCDSSDEQVKTYAKAKLKELDNLADSTND
jgi:hypothetical protein